MNDFCFVWMPQGRMPVPSGAVIDFDAVYRDLVEPAVRAADLEPLRQGGELSGPLLERLILCRFTVVDLTVLNANAFYQLGSRQSIRPESSVLLCARGHELSPFDPLALQAVPYELTAAGSVDHPEVLRQALGERLRQARRDSPKNPLTDIPLFELLDGYPEIGHERTDIFRDLVPYSPELKEKLAAARKGGAEAVREAERELGDLAAVETGVLIDLYLSYRAVRAWQDLIGLAGRLPHPLAATLLVREQLAFALNRAGRGEEAERILRDLIAERGPSSETSALLGRVYKDRWDAALQAGLPAAEARDVLDQAIEAYLEGFEADWRDTLPGINTVTLMTLREPPDPRRVRVLPVVDYANERRISAGKPDYWDCATRLELAVLRKDQARATAALADALARVREAWEPESTARNLRLIREAREPRGQDVEWLRKIEAELAGWTP